MIKEIVFRMPFVSHFQNGGVYKIIKEYMCKFEIEITCINMMLLDCFKH